MMTLTEFFWANLGNNIVFTLVALILAYIFVISMEKYFHVTIKNPINIKFSNKNPVGKIPRMKNPMRRN